MTFQIAAASPADAGVVESLMTQLAGFASGTPDANIASRFACLLNSPSHAIFVARDSQAATIGLLVASQRMTLWHSGPCAFIEELVVDREWRGQGVGQALIHAACEWASELGCSEIEVSTDCDNIEAQAFYRRLGFDHQAVLLEHELERYVNDGYGRNKKGAKDEGKSSTTVGYRAAAPGRDQRPGAGS